ncbi:uncharacterized protein LOC123475962 [Daphnia magna]|uniref:uncharacterized protein LOC123475962 n=1 Tax=Daphnia magna TaxID=35525 RepID=UPI001E1BA811|nr:uncharacterized protein LOC123475962 [Daphnia magna]
MKQVKKVKDKNFIHREVTDKSKARRKRYAEKGLFKEANEKESAVNIQKKSKSNKETLPTHVIEENNVEGSNSHEENQEFLSVVDEGNNQVPSVFDATRVIHLERRTMLEDEVNQTELLNEETESDSIHQRTRKPWNQRMKERLDDWESAKDIMYKAFVSAKAYNGNVCSICSQDLKVYVKCLTCKVTCCATCDQTLHCNSPFHERSLFTDAVSENLLPTSFIDTDGKVIQQDVAVPCVVPANCQKCLKTGKLRLHPGSGKITVVTKEGIYYPFTGDT